MTGDAAVLESVQEWGRQLKSLRDEDKMRIDRLEEEIKDVRKVQTAMQIESKEMLAIVRNTDKNITNLTSTVFSQLDEIREHFDANDAKHVHKNDIKMIERIVYGGVGFILLSVLGVAGSAVVFFLQKGGGA